MMIVVLDMIDCPAKMVCSSSLCVLPMSLTPVTVGHGVTCLPPDKAFPLVLLFLYLNAQSLVNALAKTNKH